MSGKVAVVVVLDLVTGDCRDVTIPFEPVRK